MKNQVCLITGGNSGIGKATGIELAKMGATVVILCRSREKGQAAVQDISSRSGKNEHYASIALDSKEHF